VAGEICPPNRHAADGFVLRSYRRGDGALLAAGLAGSYEHLAPWMPWAREQVSVEDCEAFARESSAQYLGCSDFNVAVLDADEGRLLGSSGFHLRGAAWPAIEAEIGLWIAAADAGRGLGTRVLSAMLDWGFYAWPWRRLEWHCDPRNRASARCAEKAGMALVKAPDGAEPSAREEEVFFFERAVFRRARGESAE
jgi:ribosomal-protein-serine acetyltransferase